MTPASYSIVQCVPDPARDERFNVGIILWADNTAARILIDDDQVKYAVSTTTHLAKGSLRSLKSLLESKLSRAIKSGGGVESFINNQTGFPTRITDPLYLEIEHDSVEHWDITAARLMERLVYPQTDRAEVAPAEDAVPETLDEKLAGYVSRGEVAKDYVMTGIKSGRERSISYFQNSSRNIAVDVILTNRAGESTMQATADAEAFKIIDLCEGSDRISKFFVYWYGKKVESKGIDETMERSISKAGGILLRDERDVLRVLSGQTRL